MKRNRFNDKRQETSRFQQQVPRPFRGIKQEGCLNRCGVAQGHFQDKGRSRIGMPV
jgi:hypothetical protein